MNENSDEEDNCSSCRHLTDIIIQKDTEITRYKDKVGELKEKIKRFESACSNDENFELSSMIAYEHDNQILKDEVSELKKHIHDIIENQKNSEIENTQINDYVSEFRPEDSSSASENRPMYENLLQDKEEELNRLKRELRDSHTALNSLRLSFNYQLAAVNTVAVSASIASSIPPTLSPTTSSSSTPYLASGGSSPSGKRPVFVRKNSSNPNTISGINARRMIESSNNNNYITL